MHHRPHFSIFWQLTKLTALLSEAAIKRFVYCEEKLRRKKKRTAESISIKSVPEVIFNQFYSLIGGKSH